MQRKRFVAAFTHFENCAGNNVYSSGYANLDPWSLLLFLAMKSPCCRPDGQIQGPSGATTRPTRRPSQRSNRPNKRRRLSTPDRVYRPRLLQMTFCYHGREADRQKPRWRHTYINSQEGATSSTGRTRGTSSRPTTINT